MGGYYMPLLSDNEIKATTNQSVLECWVHIKQSLSSEKSVDDKIVALNKNLEISAELYQQSRAKRS